MKVYIKNIDTNEVHELNDVIEYDGVYIVMKAGKGVACVPLMPNQIILKELTNEAV